MHLTLTNQNLSRISFYLFAICLLNACNLESDPKISAAPVSLKLDTQDTVPTRLFAINEDYPPQNFAAYGLLAFGAPTLNAKTEIAFCEAFRTLEHSEDAEKRGYGSERQAVTVWPVRDREVSITLNEASFPDCTMAAQNYDYAIGKRAITFARNSNARGLFKSELGNAGPYLLAWAPGTDAYSNNEDTLILVADLTNVRSPQQAKRALDFWQKEIVEKKETWENGWTIERLRLFVQLALENNISLFSFLGG